MICTGLTKTQLEQALAKLKFADNIRIDWTRSFSDRRHRFVLRAYSSKQKGARRSWTGRRSVAVCWHMHRDFLYACFAINPQAKFYTSMARYIGLEGFEQEYPKTAHKNIGSQMMPVYMPELCEC